MSESWLILVLFMIGWKSDGRFLNQSQSVVMQNQCKWELLSTLWGKPLYYSRDHLKWRRSGMTTAKMAERCLRRISTHFRRLVILTSRACQRRRCRHYGRSLRGNGFYMRETLRRRGGCVIVFYWSNFDALKDPFLWRQIGIRGSFPVWHFFFYFRARIFNKKILIYAHISNNLEYACTDFKYV